MLKKIALCLIVVLLFLVGTAKAAWKDIYMQVSEAYIEDIAVEKLAVAALKGLHQIDKELTVANDGRYVTLYYRGKVVEALRKPEEGKDTTAWGKLTEKIIDKAVTVSALAAEKDFNMEDVLALAMMLALDGDSKFYASMDDAIGFRGGNHRVFVARMEENLLYIKIKAFNKQTVSELVKTLTKFYQAQAIVIDLRGCPGGQSGAAIKAADLFLKDGIIVSTQSRIPSYEVYYTAEKNKKNEERPLFVLIDGKTASAAEIFAVALQEQGRARIIGSQSKGKGTLQKLINLSSGGVLAITNALFKTPAGIVLNKKGINPDICTFEQAETVDVDELLKKKKTVCAKQNREEKALEMRIVKAFVSYILPQN